MFSPYSKGPNRPEGWANPYVSDWNPHRYELYHVDPTAYNAQKSRNDEDRSVYWREYWKRIHLKEYQEDIEYSRYWDQYWDRYFQSLYENPYPYQPRPGRPSGGPY
eukprot:TRINITY_DN0_c1480_g1_i2.p1 TRINITY_DN0_c1480_g1~~TRINITY_DN0_c1480_g1_i2.p1  ORF type:complete len:106 (+),score=12.30 TRINITY_DN0_c1480_g1_i2:44-361(+)